MEKTELELKKYKIILFSVLGCVALTAIFFILKSVLTKDDCLSHQLQVERSMAELQYEGNRFELVSEIDAFIQDNAPGSAVNGIELLRLCDEYMVSVRFALAQGLVESHFGTKGMAARTNSVFNVKAYDNTTADEMISKGHAFAHPDYSIEPYLQLLTTKYLKDKYEEDLLIDFVDINGNRYATAPDYESRLLNAHQRISETTKIDSLYTEHRKYMIILGR